MSFFPIFGNLTLDYSLWMTAFSMITLWLALHRHIARGDMCELLLQFGADPFQVGEYDKIP